MVVKTYKAGSFNIPAIAFCIYLASISLMYVSWIPDMINTLSLYAFCGLTVFEMAVTSKFSIERPAKWYGLFIVTALISMLYTPDLSAVIPTLTDMVKIFVIVVLVGNVVNSSRKIRWAMLSLSVSTLVLMLDMLLNGQMYGSEQRLGGELTGNANTFAMIIMFGAVGTVYFIFESESFRKKIVLFGVLLAQELAIALSGGRKYFILPLVLLLIVYFKNAKDANILKKLFRLLLILFVAAALVFAVMKIPILYRSIGMRFRSMFSGMSGGQYDDSSAARMEMKKAALEFWRASPIVGNGFDSFKTMSRFGCYAHDNYAELLCNQGLVGLVMYYLYYISLIKTHFMTSKNTKWYWIVFVLCLLAFDFGAVSYYLYLYQVMLALAFCAVRVNADTER